jgi:uncharacterized protein (TIRG00374 family)
MRKLHTVLFVSGVVFLGYLVWKVGSSNLLNQLRILGWGIIPLVLSEGFANLAHTAGWRHCLTPRARPVSLALLFRMAMAGFAINYVTPSASLAGEVTKASWLASRCNGTEATSSVFLDKLCLAVAHLICVIAGAVVVLPNSSLPMAFRALMLAGTLALGGGIVGFLLVQRYGKLGSFVGWLVSHKVGGRALEKLARNLSTIDQALRDFHRERPRELLFSISWHLVGHLTALAQVWLFFYVLNQPVSLSGVVTAGFLGLWFDLLTFAVPLSLGALEGSRIVALQAIGSTALLGMTYGMAQRLAQLFWAGFGLLNYAAFISRREQNKASAPLAGRLAALRRPPQFDKPGSGR